MHAILCVCMCIFFLYSYIKTLSLQITWSIHIRRTVDHFDEMAFLFPFHMCMAYFFWLFGLSSSFISNI